ncbi:MAG: hypothetical protein QOE14_231, partial [Humisphaera sp.]|nr:hypothetical protein [Humisphaera sp.]
ANSSSDTSNTVSAPALTTSSAGGEKDAELRDGAHPDATAYDPSRKT